MRLLFIYGPPAAGKLTVSKEIAERTGFKLFHNHLTVDAVAPVFEFGSQSFFKLIEIYRLEMIAEAAARGVDLIFTYCYAKDEDDPHVAKVIETVESRGGEVCFVLLKCSREELDRRVLAESRDEHGKIKSVGMLDEILGRYDLLSPIPHRESLVIDNSQVRPEDAAEQVIRHFGLEQV